MSRAHSSKEKQVRPDIVGVEEVTANIHTHLDLMVPLCVGQTVHVVVDVDDALELRIATHRIGREEVKEQEGLQKPHQGLLRRSARVDRYLRLTETVKPRTKLVDHVLIDGAC